jgi:sugar lactone lactonase YvrE
VVEILGVPQPASHQATVLGEGVRWDARHDELLWVDIVQGRLFRERVDPDGGLQRVRRYDVGAPLGAVAPVDGDDGYLLAAGRGFARLAPDGAVDWLAEPAPGGTRMNDAACDPAGRLWAGTLADDHHEGGGALFRLDVDGSVRRVLDGLTIANGLGWSPDGATLYLNDSGPGVVLAFDFDVDRGTLSGRRELVRLGGDQGSPDGLTMDDDGYLWVALYGAGRVHRYDPQGGLDAVVQLPVPQSTCCWFGGPDLTRLFVTTATEGYTDDQRAAQPLAGRIFSVPTRVRGTPAAAFRPVGPWWPGARAAAAAP